MEKQASAQESIVVMGETSAGRKPLFLRHWNKKSWIVLAGVVAVLIVLGIVVWRNAHPTMAKLDTAISKQAHAGDYRAAAKTAVREYSTQKNPDLKAVAAYQAASLFEADNNFSEALKWATTSLNLYKSVNNQDQVANVQSYLIILQDEIKAQTQAKSAPSTASKPEANNAL